MISWLQRNFQQHYKILFGLLLIVVIISFVFVTNASSGLGPADRYAQAREVFGHNLGSEQGQARVFGDANLSATLQLGYAGFGAEQLQQYAFQRLAALHLADELHLPVTATTEIADHIKTLRAFAGENGQFDASRYASFRDSLKAGGTVTEADVARVLADDVRAGKAQQLVTGPGYVLDADIKAQLTRADTRWTLGLATVNYAAYSPSLAPSNADLAKFFEDNAFRYEIGPRIVVNAVNFPVDAYLSGITVSEGEIRGFFDANPARFQKPAGDTQNPAALKPAEAADFLLVRDQVEAALKTERARRLAAKAASDFSLALYEGHVKPEGVPAALAARKLEAKPLAPFTREAGPVEFDGSPDIAAEAFKLNATRHFSDAVPHAQGAVVLFWQDARPARTPLLSEVLEKVTADYNENEKRKRFVELGRSLKAALETRLKAGDSFETAAAAAGRSAGVTVEAKLLPAFTPREPAPELDYSVFSALERLDQGQVSDMVITADKGLLVHAASKELPDLSPANPQYAEARVQLATLTARLAASEYINHIVAEELKRSEPKVN